MKVELVSHTQNADKIIEKAGRVCYQSQEKTTEDSHKTFTNMLLSSGHESVLEHASATFKISEVSRSLTHQLVRHRVASYSQKSQRYCKEKRFGYIVPQVILDEEHLELAYDRYMKKAQDFYNELLDSGVKPEDARYVLPEACHTEIVMTANFREWRHFLKLRLSKRAQQEIRDLSLEILKELCKISGCFEDLEFLHLDSHE